MTLAPPHVIDPTKGGSATSLPPTFGVEKDPHGKDPHEPGAKLDDGKLKAGLGDQFSLAIEAAVDISTFGALKYTVGGWQTVPNGLARYWDAFNRHRLKMAYETNDPDSGRPHLHHMLWNLMAVVELEERRRRTVAPTDQILRLTGER